ncbi:hypothetical protein [Candidatus Tisiphia endosymbiont of Nemotelus uliginosus]|uniref:hypothetical protein n=1 Tax=Candidatus Tisiphia endosymbiont of Nemotelus uliginosus TaxID=3077926 RepID=UPI0035C91615
MENSDTNVINDHYLKILQRVKDAFVSFSAELLIAYKYARIVKKALYTTRFINILQENIDLLNYLTVDTQKHLSSFLQGEGYQAIDTLKQKAIKVGEIPKLTTDLTQIIEYLDHYTNNYSETVEVNTGIQKVQELTENLIQQCCNVIKPGPDPQEPFNKFQAYTIALNVDILLREQHHDFLDQMLLIKELWQVDRIVSSKKLSNILLFHSNILLLLKKDKVQDYEEALKKIINFLLYDHNVLIELPNASLVNLYKRLKDINDPSLLYSKILVKIYEEAKFRAHDNKININGYELFKLFESYNTILHQIENAEFAIVEKFLLKRSAFLHEVLINITKHIDSIIITSVTNSPELSYILSHIRKALTQNIQNGHTISLMISSLESKLTASIHNKVIRRYGALDSFTKNLLKNRYQLLFNNIIALNEININSSAFIQRTIIQKIASDYRDYKINVNSDSTLRVIHNEREEILKQLSEINFIELFQDRYLNKMSSLNFKKYARKENTQTPGAYVKLIIQILLNNFTVAQLQALMQFLLDGHFVTIHSIVKQELLLQVKKRMTLGKILYYIFTRRKDEITMLNNIKKSLNASL